MRVANSDGGKLWPLLGHTKRIAGRILQIVLQQQSQVCKLANHGRREDDEPGAAQQTPAVAAVLDQVRQAVCACFRAEV